MRPKKESNEVTLPRSPGGFNLKKNDEIRTRRVALDADFEAALEIHYTTNAMITKYLLSNLSSLLPQSWPILSNNRTPRAKQIGIQETKL